MFAKPFANAFVPTVGAVSDLKFTLVIEVTFLKASVPMLVTLPGIVIVVRAVFLKHEFGIEVRSEPREMLERLEQFSNADTPS